MQSLLAGHKMSEIRKSINQAIDNLDKNKINILYFSYDLNFHNLYHSPLLIFGKIFNKLAGNKSIDHVTHISNFNFNFDTNLWDVWIQEACIDTGIRKTYLFDRLLVFQGTCYIETLNNVDRAKAKAFELKYSDNPYSKTKALFSALDIGLIDKIYNSLSKILKRPDINTSFCSWLEALFLKDQGIDISTKENGNPDELTPADIFEMNLGKKSIFFKS
jgi:hypothetical protein